MLISESQILDVLRRQNQWWRTGSIPVDLAPPFKRLAYYEAQRLLRQPELNRAIILSGARRVGKTVILHQLADEALQNGYSPKKILYITFEDLTLTQANLPEILTLYEKNIEGIGKDTLILLDEIHYAADWSRWLMTIIKEYPKAKIAATGSAAVLIRDAEINESGVGRWTSVHVPTLSFYEYIHLRITQGNEIKIPRLSLDVNMDFMKSLNEKQRELILAECIPLQREFNHYLLQGGFPASVSEKFSLDLAQRLLREDVIDKALKRDMAHLYGARSLGEVDQIFVYLCFNLGAIVEKNTLAKEMGVAAMTVEKHLQRLEDAHLIYRLPPFSIEGKKSLKPRPKVYIADPTLRNAVILRGESIFENEAELGKIIEACVFKHLYAFYYPEHPRFGYWRSSRGDQEVDFLMIYPDSNTFACEVKYSEKIRLGSNEGIMQLADSPKPPRYIYLITKNHSDFGPLKGSQGKMKDAIFQIPAFIFTYLLGYIEHRRWLKETPTEGIPYGESSQSLPEEMIKTLPKTEGEQK